MCSSAHGSLGVQFGYILPRSTLSYYTVAYVLESSCLLKGTNLVKRHRQFEQLLQTAKQVLQTEIEVGCPEVWGGGRSTDSTMR